MIRIVTLLVLYFVSQVIGAQSTTENNSATNTITVTVPNVSGAEGVVIVALYSSNENFMKREATASKNGIIKDGKSTVVFENVAAGEYAIVCLHDKNSNKRMDFNEGGMPLEDYGSSNNVMAFGPPTFEDAKFIVENKSLDLTIKF